MALKALCGLPCALGSDADIAGMGPMALLKGCCDGDDGMPTEVGTVDERRGNELAEFFKEEGSVCDCGGENDAKGAKGAGGGEGGGVGGAEIAGYTGNVGDFRRACGWSNAKCVSGRNKRLWGSLS